MVKRSLILVLLWLFVAGCTATPTPVITGVPTVTATPTATQPPAPRITPTPDRQLTLEVWLPPQFDTVTGTVAGDLLQARLDQFATEQADVIVQMRIKPLDGPGGLLDSLTTASAAAPLALPDLVALPRPMLETAALKGLLRPFDDLVNNLEDTDWYDYALQLSQLQDSHFGQPFAGDALVLVYRKEIVPEPPSTLTYTLHSEGPLIFPAGDPQALYTLALYQAAGGSILDDEGRPFLEEEPLLEVLSYYHEAALNEFTPFWLTQFQSDDQAWDAFQTGQANMVVTWASRYLKNKSEDIQVVPIPTLDGKNFTLATGWVWALASPFPERQRMAAELAIFLSDSEFLAQWTEATGYLPPRPSALSDWNTAGLRAIVEDVSSSAYLYPSADVLPGLAAPLSEATILMLKQQRDPASAAQEAVNRLLGP